MHRKKREIVSVQFAYVGTDEQFNSFLKMMIHDYLAVDDLHSCRAESFVDKVESKSA